MDFWKKAAAAALALVLSLSAFPVTAFAAANKGDTLMWVDDMTTHGFYYQEGYTDPEEGYISEEAVLNQDEFSWEGAVIAMRGDGVDLWYESFKLNTQMTSEKDYIENIKKSLPLSAKYTMDPYKQREYPLELHTATVNGATFYYVCGTNTTRASYVGAGEYEQSCNVHFFDARVLVGGYVFKMSAACLVDQAKSGQELFETFAHKIHFRDIEGTYVGDTTGGKVQILSISPESGQRQANMISRIVIKFSHNIESVNLDQGGIYLCDMDTDEVVYQSKNDAYTQARILARGNCLSWDIPAYSKDAPFEPEHTYYLKMDKSFLTFQGTDKKIGILDRSQWYYSIRHRDIVGEFYFNGQEGLKKSNYCYSNDYFMQSSYTYNSELATLSSKVALAAYNGQLVSQGYANVEEMLANMGFADLYHNADYTQEPTAHSTGVCIGSRQLGYGTTLVAIAVRGGNYAAEWGGNFVIGTGTHHEGFQRGSDKVIAALKQYLQDNQISGSVKFWITGYSRGGAIANLTAARLDEARELGDNVYYSAEDVYAYCFEVPANTTDPQVGDELYGNIFNIINPIDLVPRVAPAAWGFSRYGRNVYIPAKGVDREYSTYISKVKSSYAKYCPGISPTQLQRQQEILNILVEKLRVWLVDREFYRQVLEDELVGVLVDLAGNTGYDFFTVETADRLTTKLLAVLILEKEGFLERDVTNTGELPSLVLETGVKKFTMDSFMKDTGLHKSIWSNITQMVDNVKDYYMDYLGALLEAVAFAHTAEFTMCWMEALENTGVLENTMEYNSTKPAGTYAQLLVKYNCPVSVTAKDAEGNVLASIDVDGNVTVAEDGGLDAYMDETGAKVFSVPHWMDVYFEATATADGHMTVTVETVSMAGDVLSREQYKDLELVRDESYTVTVDSGTVGSDYAVTLSDPAGESLTGEKTAGEALAAHTVTAEAENGTVLGGGSYTMGAFVSLQAQAHEGYVFAGWYDETGAKLGSEPTLTFRVDGDRTVRAAFEQEAAFPVGLVAGIAVAVLAVGGVLILLGKRRKKA